MFDSNAVLTLRKIKRLDIIYYDYLFKTLFELETEYTKPERPHFDLPAKDVKWEKAEHGMVWGEGEAYAWFHSTLKVPKEYEGQPLWLLSGAGEAEGLVFVNNKPIGLFDYCEDLVNNRQNRLHRAQRITASAVAGESFDILMEAYGGRNLKFCEVNGGDCGERYPVNRNRVFNGMYVVQYDEVVHEFLLKLNMVVQVFENMTEKDAVKWDAMNTFTDVFAAVSQYPQGVPSEEWHEGLKKANEIMTAFLTQGKRDGSDNQFFGLIGHSHLDTAWLWTLEETHHKAARTFSNALSLLDRYDEYKFVQSSAIYVDWMKKHYPDIYEGIKKYTAEGRWEPNGGSWVECDGNMTGGEYLIRQFLRGQRYLAENLGYRGDCFWQPDTFGYSPAIPQIMLGCGMKYFLTTKLAWNENNQFPHDTFIWRGIDGSEVLTHFNLIHVWPDVKTVKTAPIMNPEKANAKLISYGLGDGGGGPSPDMIETARILNDMPYMPECKHTTVSEFMQRLEKSSRDLTVYDGELYLDLHRGTLTQMHDIKRSNRKAEIAIHNLEATMVHSGLKLGKTANVDRVELLDVLLTNQFHDILPGTSIESVNKLAMKQNYELIETANNEAKSLLAENSDSAISVYNTLGFDRNDAVVLDGKIDVADYEYQQYVDIDGVEKTVVAAGNIPALAAVTLKQSGEKKKFASAFVMDGNELRTPIYNVKFSNNGELESLVDLRTNRELATDTMPLNSLVYGEDVPIYWDNWDINYDYKLKLNNRATLKNTEIITDGAVEYRIRRTYSIGYNSELVQDTVFYAENPRIDFESKIDWKEKYTILKAFFPVNVHAHFARFETQFGYVERANNENNCYEQAKFEVCNHKWTDFSENRYGVAILNDCKYGISVEGNVMALTLHRGSCRPDETGDEGVHKFTYSFLPHNNGFSVDSVIRQAYYLNYEPLVFGGSTTLTKSLVSIESDSAVIETVKPAEDGDGFIVRIYESECNATSAKLKVAFPFEKVCETNMLEEEIAELDANGNTLDVQLKPFQIKTFKFYNT